ANSKSTLGCGKGQQGRGRVRQCRRSEVGTRRSARAVDVWDMPGGVRHARTCAGSWWRHVSTTGASQTLPRGLLPQARLETGRGDGSCLAAVVVSDNVDARDLSDVAASELPCALHLP